MAPFARVRSLKRQHASQAAGLAAVTIAAAVLIGWWTGVPILSSWGAGLPPLRPLAALCLAALGVALVHPGKDSRLPFAAGLAVAGLAALGVALVLFNVDFGIINRWLVPSAAAPGLGRATFRAASAGTVALGLAGGSHLKRDDLISSCARSLPQPQPRRSCGRNGLRPGIVKTASFVMSESTVAASPLWLARTQV